MRTPTRVTDLEKFALEQVWRTVRINDGPVLATFAHIRSDGLAYCLRRAAAALERAPIAQKEEAE